jgi:hypothetical protein
MDEDGCAAPSEPRQGHRPGSGALAIALLSMDSPAPAASAMNAITTSPGTATN